MLEQGPTRNITAVDLSRCDVKVIERADGTGSISFGTTAPALFTRVDNAREVFQCLSGAQQKLLSASSEV